MSSHSLPVDSDPADSRWRELEDLLDELAQASKSALTADAFYRQLLARIVPAVGACGGAIWSGRGTDELRLESQVNLAAGQMAPSHEVLERHQPLVEDVMRCGEPRAVPPGSAAPSDNADGASWDSWLIFHPFQSADAPGVIELLGRREMTPAEAREYVRILAAVVEVAEDFHRHGELRQLRERAAAWRQYEAFAQRVHESLDVDQTAFLIANDACRVVDCDRISILVRHGAKFRATATSGVDVLERRAKIVRRLEQLAARCAAGGEAVWYYDGSAAIADEIEGPLTAYLDESHARQLAIVPLGEPRAEADRREPRVIGVLVAEQFQSAASPELLRERVTAVSGHVAVALSNALVHSRMPLARVGRMLGGVRWLAEARQLPKTLIVLGLIAAGAAALALVPADFNVEAQGEFQPKVRRDVFASDDGVVRDLLVDHGSAVRSGEPLVVLRNPELDLESRRLAGEMQTAAKKLATVEAERLENAPARDDARRDRHELAADEEELKELLAGLGEQRAILQQRQDDLTIRSPIDGQALSWNIKQSLEARPVERGQALLTVGDLAGPWVLELHVPDDRTGQVLAARDRLRPDLDVSFVLASEPGKVIDGRIAEMALATELDKKAEPTVLVAVDFDKRDVEGLRPGGTAHAKIHCGRRSLGYVWLSDLFHYVQSLWW
jgi:HlyD family secretion protein